MEYKLVPILLHQVFWKAYIEVFKDFMGESPTRILDISGLKLDAPSAFEKTVKECFNSEGDKHSFIGFIGIADERMLLHLSTNTKLEITYVESDENRGQYIFIITGNLQQWHTALDELSKSTNKAIAVFRVSVEQYLRSARL